MIGWFTPGGMSETVATWKGPDGTIIQKRRWASQAEQVLYLRGIVDVYRGTETIRQQAIRIVFELYRCQPKAKAAHALAIGDWVQKNITYVEEMPERFITPIRLLKMGHPAADCDDFTTLISSLCESIGIPCKLCAVWWQGGYRHIFPVAIVAGRAIPLDATLRGPVGVTDPIKLALALHGPEARTLCL